MRVRQTKLLPLCMVAGAAIAGAITAMPSATAAGPDVGSHCQAADINNTADASDGTTVRCIADEQGALTWLPDTAAVGTIGSLQAAGYTVTVDRVGDHPLVDCAVAEVHNAMTTTARTGSGGSGPGGTGSTGDHHSSTIVLTKSIDVSLDCRG